MILDYKIISFGPGNETAKITILVINAATWRNCTWIHIVYLSSNGKYYDFDTEIQFNEILSRHSKKIIFQWPVFNDLFS